MAFLLKYNRISSVKHIRPVYIFFLKKEREQYIRSPEVYTPDEHSFQFKNIQYEGIGMQGIGTQIIFTGKRLKCLL